MDSLIIIAKLSQRRVDAHSLSLFLQSFNAAPGTGAAMRSAAARLSIMTIEERKELKTEIREALGPIGLNLKTLHKMKKLDNFVCEVSKRTA